MILHINKKENIDFLVSYLNREKVLSCIPLPTYSRGYKIEVEIEELHFEF